MEWKKLLCDERIRKTNRKPEDYRSEFEKDYHRIIQSASLRRLQDKTQVFPLDKSDFIRTRLTHSLEVSSYGKSLGQSIGREILEKIRTDRSFNTDFLPEYAGYICDILQCAGLLHDIGNPPFGHFGEMVIRDWFRQNLGRLTFEGRPLSEFLCPQMREDFYNFEGNTQALRLVTKLHYIIDEHGMNLTKALLGTIIKYPVSSLEINKKDGDICHKKMGYFYGDREIFEKIDKSLGLSGRRHPLAFILEAADDIAYLTADIEDAFKKGCIDLHHFSEEFERMGRGLNDPGYSELLKALNRKYERALEKDERAPEIYAIQNWMPAVQTVLVNSARDGFINNYEVIMDGSMKTDLMHGSLAGQVAEALGSIAFKYAFVSKPILKLEIAADRILGSLLDCFVKAAINYDTGNPLTSVQEKLIGLVSENYMTVYHKFSEGKSPEEKLYLRLLLVTDEICGMTDSYAQRLYQDFNGLL